MANLGNIGFVQAVTSQTAGRGGFTLSKKPVNVVVHIDDALPYAGGIQVNPLYFMTQQGTFVQRSNVDSSGNGYAYDLDDGAYTATQAGTGNVWGITVLGTVVTIIRLASSGVPVSIYAA